MEESRARFWYRSSPVVGAIGGFLSAVSAQLFGKTWEPGWLYDLYLAALFDTTPVLGYALFVVGGAALGWVFQRFEDRYVFE